MKTTGVLLTILAYVVGAGLIALPVVGGIDYFLSGQTAVWWLKYWPTLATGVALSLSLYHTGLWLRRKSNREEVK